MLPPRTFTIGKGLSKPVPTIEECHCFSLEPKHMHLSSSFISQYSLTRDSRHGTNVDSVESLKWFDMVLPAWLLQEKCP